MEPPPVIPARELDEHLPGAVLLDVRRPEEIAESGTLSGALCIPLDELPERLGELPLDTPLLTA